MPSITRHHLQSIIGKGRNDIVSTTQPKKAYKGWAMEGLIARWYSSNTGKNIEEFKKAARTSLSECRVEVMCWRSPPVPGSWRLSLPSSVHTASSGWPSASRSSALPRRMRPTPGVEVTFREGNASSMPFESNSFKNGSSRWSTQAIDRLKLDPRIGGRLCAQSLSCEAL